MIEDENIDLQKPVEEEDALAKTPDFSAWLSWTQANVSHLRCLLKLADKIDNEIESDGEDGAFEDIEIDSDNDA